MIIAFLWLLACDEPCPSGMAQLGELCIDRYEATIGEDGIARSIAGATPTTAITHAQAVDACRRAGKRLCYDREWVSACRGRAWPWGEEPPVAGQCPIPGDSGDDTLDELAPAGSYPHCATPEGVHDLYGNAWEWTAHDSGAVDASAKRGGAWYIAGPSPCTGAPFVLHEPSFTGTIAARCCADALPGWR